MIDVQNVYKSFGEKIVLNNINFQIYDGEITFVVGTSGAGKTTLMNILGGLLSPDLGSVYVDGANIARNTDDYRAEKVGFVFQDFNLISGLDIEQNVLLGDLYSKNVCLEESGGKIKNLLQQTGLTDIKQKTETLSGGEKQRVAFARCLIKNSRVVIADEPTGNLDTENGDKILSLLEANKVGRYIIVVSHDTEKAERFADRIIKIEDGRIVEDRYNSGKGNRLAGNIEEKNFEIQVPSLGFDTTNQDTTKQTGCRSKNRKEKKRKRRKVILILGINSLKRRIGKTFSMVVVIACAISALVVVGCFNSAGDAINTKTNIAYLESDLIMIALNPKTESKYQMIYRTFDESQILEIQEAFPGATIVECTSDDFDREYFFGLGATTHKGTISIFKPDDFFQNRIMSLQIEGDFPSEEDEIILAEDVANCLFSNNVIGKTVLLHDGQGSSIELKITGINHTRNPYDEFYSYVSETAMKKLKTLIMKNRTEAYIPIEAINESRDVDAGISMNGKLNQLNFDETILAGRLPENESEIIISSRCATLFWGSDWQKKSREIFFGKYYIGLRGAYEVSICGVFDSDDRDVRYYGDLIEKITVAEPVTLNVYLPETYNPEQVCMEINESGKYSASYSLQDLKKQIEEQTLFYSLAVLVFGLILVVISVALIDSFAKINLFERRREMAIIRSLGASKTDLIATLMFDELAISGLAFVLSAALTFLVLRWLPCLIKQGSLLQFDYPWHLQMTIGISFAFVASICTFLHFVSVVKKAPAELLKEN